MEVARRSLLVITWTVLGIVALIGVGSGERKDLAFGLLVVGLAIALTIGINWIFAGKKP